MHKFKIIIIKIKVYNLGKGFTYMFSAIDHVIYTLR